MSQPTTPQTCFICRKHRGEIESPGGAVYEDDLVFAGHAFIPDGKDAAYLGMLLLEPKRHAANWSDLTDAEGSALGRIRWRRCVAATGRRDRRGPPASVHGRTTKLRAVVPLPNGVETVIGPVVAPAGTVATMIVGLRTEKVADTPLKVTFRA